MALVEDQRAPCEESAQMALERQQREGDDVRDVSLAANFDSQAMTTFADFREDSCDCRDKKA